MGKDNLRAVVPKAETEEEKRFLESHIRDLRKLIIEIAYSQGFLARQRGYFGIEPHWSKLSIRWNWAYGCTDLLIDDKEMGTRHELRIFGQREKGDYSLHFNMRVAVYTDELLEMFLPGIRIAQSIRQCAMPFHFQPQWGAGFKSFWIDTEPHVTICRPKDGRWFCQSCEDRYSLPEGSAGVPDAKKKTQAEIERAKMTVTMRFDVLTSCDFTCGICGRSPLKGDDVKLHVDHKVPVSKGGKTIPENLWALCQECNLGKSDKIVKQLTLELGKE